MPRTIKVDGELQYRIDAARAAKKAFTASDSEVDARRTYQEHVDAMYAVASWVLLITKEPK